MTSVIFFLIALMGVLIFLLAKSGRANRNNTLLKSSLSHKRYAKTLLWVTVVQVLAVEARVRMNGGVFLTDALFFSHLAFAILFFIALLALNLRVTGERNPQWHGTLAYWLILFYCVMAATAIPLILRSAKHNSNGHLTVSVYFFFLSAFRALSRLAHR